MSSNLRLYRVVPAARKGQRPDRQARDVQQTPTTVAEGCRSFLTDRWQVFDAYRTWCGEGDQEHLEEVRDLLREGWSWEIV